MTKANKVIVAIGCFLVLACGESTEGQPCQCGDGAVARDETGASRMALLKATPEPGESAPAELLFEEGKTITLPPPDKILGMPLMEAITRRQSGREFDDQMLSLKQLSNLLYAAHGVSRPDSGKRTTPTARNLQDMEVYVATAKGLFVYDAGSHGLTPVLPKDIRATTGKQEFVSRAPVNLVYVSDYSKLGDLDDAKKLLYSGAHAGFIGQNVYLYCASEGLSTVVRAHFDADELGAAMRLPEDKHIVLAQTVGFGTIR